MTISATYMSDLSRVRVAFSGYSTDADYAKVERTTDGITWYTVRGGDTVALTAGAGKLDDYDGFTAGVLNTYRVTAIDSAAMSWVGSGGPVTANNATVTPACSGSTAVGDLVLLFATIRNSGAGVPVQPAGWTTLADLGNARIFGRYATAAGSVAQAVTFTGGVANADTTAQMTSFRNAGIVPLATPATLVNASAQNINWPSSTPPSAPSMAIGAGWKQDDWSSAPTTGSWDAELGQVAATAGDDAGHVWWYQAKATTAPRTAGFWTVTGGAAAISSAAVFFLGRRPFTDQETVTITPMPSSVWLKYPTKPSLNTPITVTDWSDITRESRGAEFPVVGRTLPVAITDVMGSRQLTLTVTTATLAAAADLDKRLAAGDIAYIQAPSPTCPVPTLYAVIKGYPQGRHSKRTIRRFFDLPLIEVAAPGATVYGDTYVYNDVLTSYASYSAVLSGVSSYSNLLDKVSTGEVVVP